jgi:non-specific serine/threonine protein kinase/serine/threonine-protein kinase
MFELHDAISTLPGSTAARELLVKRAMQYLESLSKESGNRPDLQREVALGYARVGEVQGYLGESNLGQLPAALANFEKAEAMLARLMERTPGDASLRHDYNRAANLLAHSYIASGQFARALSLAQKNVAFAEAGLRSDPNEPHNVQSMVASLTALADQRTDQQQYAEAIPLRERIEQLSQRLVTLQPGNAEALRTLALAQKKLGALYGVSKRYEDARREYQQAAAIDERRVADNANNMRAKLDLSYDYSDLGWVAGRLGKNAESLAAYRRVLALREEAARVDPRDQRAAESLASAADKIGIALRRTGDLKGSEEALRRAIGLYDELTRRSRSSWTHERDLAMTHDDLADTLEAQCAKSAGGAACRARVSAELATERTLLEGLQQKGLLPKADGKLIDDVKEREAKLKHGGQ